MRYHFMFIFMLLYDGFLSIADAEDNKIDPCEPNPCQNGGQCYKGDIEGEFVCLCFQEFTGKQCEINRCKPNPCQNGGSCTVSRNTEGFSCDCPAGYSGDTCDYDHCILCEEDEICVIENGSRDCQKKQKIIDEKDLCSEHLCLNDGNCLVENGVPKCNCSGPFRGEKCELGLCDSNPCQNFGKCDVKGSGFICECIVGYIGDTCEKSEYDASENPATTMNISISSATTTTSKTAKSDTTTVSGKTLKTTIKEISKKDELSNDSTTVVKSSSAFTKFPKKITESTKRVGTTIKVSSTDLSTTLIGISSETNTADYHKSSLSFVKTSTFNDNKVKTSDTSTNTIVTTTPTVEMSLEETEQTINGIITHNFASTKYTEGTTFVEDRDKTFHITSSTTVSTTTTIKTPTNESDQLLNSTVTGDITIDGYNTTANVLFQSTSQSSLQINSESSSSTSISESTSDIGIKITSKKPQTEIAAFTKRKETTETVDVKSTSTFVSTTETLNSTKDKNDDSENVVNKSNTSSQNITTYVSIGVACFAAVIAFAAGGWYVKRKCRRRNHQYYRDCDSSSEISGSSESNHSYA